MARGICYHISDNADDVVDDSFSEEDLYELIEALRIDCAEDIDKEEQRDDIENLLENLKRYGFETGTEKTDKGECPFFSFTKEARERYFRPYFEEAKKLMDQMTLEEFSEFSGENTYKLRNLIQDENGDCAYEGYAKSFDGFLRESEPETKYYIGNAVLMH